MNWFNPLRRKPDPDSSAARALPPLPSSADLERLRAGLAAAPGEEARRQAQQALGEACAALERAPQDDDEAAVWCAAVRQCGDKALALDWLARLQEESHLEELARHARFTEVRLAAAQRIADSARLESLARDAKARDNNVYRHCSEVLRGRRQAQQRALHAAALEQSLRDFLGTAPLSVTRLLEIEKELGALAEAAADGEAAVQACRDLCAEANQRLRREGESLRRLQVAQQELVALARLAAQAAPGAADLGAWRAHLAVLREPGAGWPDWPAAQAAVETFERGCGELEARLAALTQDAQRLAAAESVLSGLAGMDVAQAEAAWSALELPQHPGARESLQARWSELHQATARSAAGSPAPAAAASQAPADAPDAGSEAAAGETNPAAANAAPPPGQADAAAPAAAKGRGAARARRADPEALRAVLHELEHALDEGHLLDADAAARRLKQLLEGGGTAGRLEGPLQRAQARLAELRAWAEWGARQQRDQLIAAAQELLTGGHGVDHVAAAVPAMREAWKRLNAQGAATREQWQAFDGVLEKAYLPVAALRAQEAARREQARALKAALLDEWEQWTTAIDRERPDAGAIQSQGERLLARWREAPHAGFREERQLRKRLDRLRDDIGKLLAAARSAEVQRREQLVVQAQAQREESDLRRAVAEIKQLQERWRAPPGAPRLARREEQELWKRFRSACDEVFGRRDAQHKEEAERRTRATQARGAILQRFAESIESGDAGAIRRAQAQFQSEWREAAPAQSPAAPARRGPPARPSAPPQRKAPPDPQAQEAQSLLQRARQAIEERQRASYRARLDGLRRPSAGVDGLDEEALARGRAQREDVLLELELTLDLPSPQASEDLRRRRQLARLQDRFRGTVREKVDPEVLLAKWHEIAAAADPEQERRLGAIVDRLVAQRARAA
jgi:hypothetical protein